MKIFFKKVVGACLEVVFKFEHRATYFGSFGGGGVQTHSSTSWHAKMSLTLNIYRMFFAEIFRLPPRCCVGSNQLLTNCPDELEDSSLVVSFLRDVAYLVFTCFSSYV